MSTIGNRLPAEDSAALRKRSGRTAMETMDMMASQRGWEVEHEETRRGLTRSAYRRGSWLLEVVWNDGGHGVYTQLTNEHTSEVSAPLVGEGWDSRARRYNGVFKWAGHRLHDEGLR